MKISSKNIILVIVLLLIIIGLFIWPTPVQYKDVVVGLVDPEVSYQRYFIGDTPTDKELRTYIKFLGYYPISGKIKKNRASDKEYYNIWIYEPGESEWWEGTFVSTTYYAPVNVSHKSNFGVFRRLKLNWPSSIDHKIRSGKYGSLHADLISSEWKGFKSGTKVKLNQKPDTQEIKSDLFNFEITISFKNLFSDTVTIAPYLFALTSNRKLLVNIFKEPKRNLDRILLPPNDSSDVVLITGESYSKYKNLSNFEVEHLKRGWRWSVGNMPDYTKLFAN